MNKGPVKFALLSVLFMTAMLVAACGPTADVIETTPTQVDDMEAIAEVEVTENATSEPQNPDWFSTEMTDVVSGENFSINDFAGKVVLLETMATWCPTCLKQANELQKVKEMLGDSKDVVLVSLDVDMNESEDVLKDYAALGGFDWYLAVAPRMVLRDLGNLYTADLLNPPLAPMLIIDQQGNVFGLPNGLKGAESLYKTIESYRVQ